MQLMPLRRVRHSRIHRWAGSRSSGMAVGVTVGRGLVLATAPMSDAALAEAFRRGDDAALRQIYDRFGGAVFHLATRSLANSADAEDVTQATFVAAWLGRE